MTNFVIAQLGRNNRRIEIANLHREDIVLRKWCARKYLWCDLSREVIAQHTCKESSLLVYLPPTLIEG